MQIKEELIDFLIRELTKDNDIKFNNLNFGKFCFEYEPETDKLYSCIRVYVDNHEITDLRIVFRRKKFWFWDKKIKTLKQLIEYNQNTQKEKLYFSFLPKDKQEQIKRKFKLKRILK